MEVEKKATAAASKAKHTTKRRHLLWDGGEDDSELASGGGESRGVSVSSESIGAAAGAFLLEKVEALSPLVASQFLP